MDFGVRFVADELVHDFFFNVVTLLAFTMIGLFGLAWNFMRIERRHSPSRKESIHQMIVLVCVQISLRHGQELFHLLLILE